MLRALRTCCQHYRFHVSLSEIESFETGANQIVGITLLAILPKGYEIIMITITINITIAITITIKIKIEITITITIMIMIKIAST